MKIAKEEFDSLKEQISAVKKELHLISFMRTDLLSEDFLSGIAKLADDLIFKISFLESKMAEIEGRSADDKI